ncbi:MAG: hypothetical protein NT105_07445 [Verrucomicrobia bacterium]|nr:hypothetical protein [Verrucomicrobiota bacterium]
MTPVNVPGAVIVKELPPTVSPMKALVLPLGQSVVMDWLLPLLM